MFYQKANTVGEISTDHIAVGNWSNKTQGVSQFIEVGEGTSKGVEQEPHKIENPMNNQDNLEDPPVGADKEDMEEESPTVHTTTVSGWISKPPACLIKEIGEAALTAAQQNYLFALGELMQENEFGCVGAGIGSGIDNTDELKVPSFEEAMASTDKTN